MATLALPARLAVGCAGYAQVDGYDADYVDAPPPEVVAAPTYRVNDGYIYVAHGRYYHQHARTLGHLPPAAAGGRSSERPGAGAVLARAPGRRSGPAAGARATPGRWHPGRGPRREAHGEAAGALDRLYEAPLDAFVSRRREAAAALRASGDVAASRSRAGRDQPSRTAWALNQVARRRPELLQATFEAWTKAAAAQTSGEGEDLRAHGPRTVIGWPIWCRRPATPFARTAVSSTVAQGRRISATVQAVASADDATARETLVAGRLVADIDADDPFGGIELGAAHARPRVAPPARDDLAARRKVAEAGRTRDREHARDREQEKHARDREQERQAREREHERQARQREQERFAREVEKARARVEALEAEAREARVAAREAEVAAGRGRAGRSATAEARGRSGGEAARRGEGRPQEPGRVVPFIEAELEVRRHRGRNEPDQEQRAAPTEADEPRVEDARGRRGGSDPDRHARQEQTSIEKPIGPWRLAPGPPIRTFAATCFHDDCNLLGRRPASGAAARYGVADGGR